MLRGGSGRTFETNTL